MGDVERWDRCPGWRPATNGLDILPAERRMRPTSAEFILSSSGRACGIPPVRREVQRRGAFRQDGRWRPARPCIPVARSRTCECLAIGPLPGWSHQLFNVNPPASTQPATRKPVRVEAIRLTRSSEPPRPAERLADALVGVQVRGLRTGLDLAVLPHDHDDEPRSAGDPQDASMAPFSGRRTPLTGDPPKGGTPQTSEAVTFRRLTHVGDTPEVHPFEQSGRTCGLCTLRHGLLGGPRSTPPETQARIVPAQREPKTRPKDGRLPT